jgi:pyruvate,water dikinase
VRFRRQRGDDEQDEAMAVVVMGFIGAESAGVAFTRHPVSGRQDVVLINASLGLGEAVVAGRVTPDSFLVSKSGRQIVERDIFEKTLIIEADEALGGTLERAPSPVEARSPSLTDEEAGAVADLAVRVEAHFGAPQDIEWAFAGGRLYLLQARPITTA